MENRFKNILHLLSTVYDADMGGRRSSPYVVAGFKELRENLFELEVDVNPLGMIKVPGAPFANIKKRDDLMTVEFYPADDDVFTIRISHVFGVLDTGGMDLDSVGRQFLAFLSKNVGSFAGTGAYIGIQRQGNTMFASLNCMLHFLVEWSDHNIANILSFQLAQIYKSLEVNQDPSLTMLKRLS
jgi:hypothetical protein